MSLKFLDTILRETLTEEEYLQERMARSHSSAGIVKAVLSNVKLFCIDQADSDFDMILVQLKRDADNTGKTSKSIAFFQRFVNWLHTPHPQLKMPSNHFGHFEPYRAKSVVTIRNYVGQLRLYFKKVVGIEISSEKLDDFLTYPAIGEVEEAEALTHDEFRNIINHIKNPRRQMLYLIKKDTCSRIGAMCQLRVENFNTTTRPIQVTFPAHIMKKNKRGESRTVIKYVTLENEPGLLKLLESYSDPRDIVFGTNSLAKRSVHNEEKFWNKLVKKIGYTEVYRHNGRIKKNIHSIKAFTETQAEKAVNKFYADAYGDHDEYLKQYIRWSNDEKIQKFKTLEPHLNLFTKIETVSDNPELVLENQQLQKQLDKSNAFLDELVEKEKLKTRQIASGDLKELMLKVLQENNII